MQNTLFQSSVIDSYIFLLYQYFALTVYEGHKSELLVKISWYREPSEYQEQVFFVSIFQGDSGGPLTCYFPRKMKYYLLGITSYGVGCGRPRLPGIYVRIMNYRHWVNSRAALINRTTNISIQSLLLFFTVGAITIQFPQ